MPRAADVLIDSLKVQDVDRVFCVPGESYLGAIDALYDAPEIDIVRVRHEGGGGFMAVADAKYTGRTGVEFVSRGPELQMPPLVYMLLSRMPCQLFFS